MDEEALGYAFEVSAAKKKELKEQSVEGDGTEQLIMLYLQSSPYASWEQIGGQTLWLQEDTALHAVKQFLQLQKGKYMHRNLLCSFFSGSRGTMCYALLFH